MFFSLGSPVCDDAVTPKALDSALPANTPAAVDTLLIQPITTNTGRVWICDTLSAAPLANPPLGVVFWFPAPAPGRHFMEKLTSKTDQGRYNLLGKYYVVSEVPGEGVHVAGSR